MVFLPSRDKQRNTNTLFTGRKVPPQRGPAGDSTRRITPDAAVIPKVGASLQDDFRGYPDE